MVCREDGVSDFDKPRAAVGRLGSRDAFLYSFDLLEIDGEDLRRCEWQVRPATPRSLIKRARAEQDVTTEAGIDVFKRQPDGKWSIARFFSFTL